MEETKPFVISKQVVKIAFDRVKANKGTYGIDEQTIADFEENLKDNLYKIWNRMSSGTYFPKPVKAVAKTEDSLGFANVTFEPRCRNNWHIHKATKGGGQVLICVEGEGWYQEEGKKAQSLKAGDIITIPANIKHWHGAKADSWFSHIAVEVPGENTSNEWLEPVKDEEYDKL